MSEFKYNFLVYEASQLGISSTLIPLPSILKSPGILCRAVHGGPPDLQKFHQRPSRVIPRVHHADPLVNVLVNDIANPAIDKEI